MPERTQLWRYCDLYRTTFKAWREKIGEPAAHQLAQRRADASPYRLTSEERKKFRAWADGKWPARKKKPETEKAALPFDEDVMRAE